MNPSQVTNVFTFSARQRHGVVQKPTDAKGLTLEAWSSGFLVGAFVIMGCITIANMRRGVLLHKLILLELFLAIWRGFWLFPGPPVYSWWLSVGGLLLDSSWSLHNVIAWMKVTPFLPRRVSQVFIGTVIFVQPYWIVEIYANFTYFHGGNKLFLRMRPWEALCRDPWWIFASSILFWKIKMHYQMTLKETISISPRFGIMLLAATLSVVFFVLDICAVTNIFDLGLPNGINPFWKFPAVFKYLMDCVILDDFKTALERLRAYKISHIGSFSQDTSALRTRDNGELARAWEGLGTEARACSEGINPGGTLVQTSNFTSVEPSTKDIEHGHFSQVHKATTSPPSSSPRSFGNATLAEIHNPKYTIPSPSEDGVMKTLEDTHICKK